MHSSPPHAGGDTSDAPTRFVDGADREVAIELYRPERFASLVAMYDDFAPGQRAQGLPPKDEPRIEAWLENVLEGTNLVAVHDDAVVGHIMLVPDGDGAHELGVFVHQNHQGVGVGTELLRTGFEHARWAGITHVWLTVERLNRRAYELYQRLEFTEDHRHSRRVRMSREL